MLVEGVSRTLLPDRAKIQNVIVGTYKSSGGREIETDYHTESLGMSDS